MPARDRSEAEFFVMETGPGLRPLRSLPGGKPAPVPVRGAINDESDDQAPGERERRVDGARALHRLLEDMPAGAMVEAHGVAALIAVLLGPELEAA